MIDRKIKFILLLCLTGAAVFSQGTWERIGVPTAHNLNSICFVDSLYGWVAGDSGTLLHTIDGGNSWIHQNSLSSMDVAVVFFLNRNLGWASVNNFTTVPYGTVLLKTTNGGADWVSQPFSAENIFITCILFRDSLNGWMGGKPHALMRSADGGTSWAQAAIDTSILAFFPVLSIQFYNDRYGYASGGMFDIAGVTWHTFNGGELWYAIDPSQAPADEVHNLHIFDSLNVMGAGGDPDFAYGVGMIRTSDGGMNWNYTALEIQGNAYDLDFRNDLEAWAPLGPKQKLIYSMDAGITWKAVPTPDSTSIYVMTFPDSLHGFAGGRNGAVLKYHPKILPGIRHDFSQDKGYVLYQNTPNPSTSGTIIRFSIPSPAAGIGNMLLNAPVQLKVYNILGEEVASLVRDILPPGTHEIELATAGLPAGIYFYRLQLLVKGSVITVAGPKRMVIAE